MPQVRAHALMKLDELREQLVDGKGGNDAERAQRFGLLDTLKRFAQRPLDTKVKPAEVPPGSPLG
ncbi:hypothetical protein RM530_07950 [Algiphilus sp. W345]|uniref:Uncharacterized protein n=1 Tax=Banduia mediterranea TaxID=3075609 RepID=A0ABU2WHF1_9GAMM|nr:hypothetical protein [Algiphilus sp. W345]MDT0497297.1 hypothetical protein [Algiphilus sp. W345]